MRSPFPGMDPYLEDPAFWPDFHATFINYWREEIADVLPGGYEARIGERVSLAEIPPPEEWDGRQSKTVVPDISVSHRTAAGRSTAAPATTLALEPVQIPLLVDLDEVTETYIRILRRADHSLVTVLELLSPTNKTDFGYFDYLAKRHFLLRQKVHLVELDLLIAGKRMPTASPLPAAHYHALVARANRTPIADVYSWTIRDPLPTIRVPLKAPDPDIEINLAPVFATAYDRGRYGGSLRYAGQPLITLGPGDQAWCAEIGNRARTD